MIVWTFFLSSVEPVAMEQTIVLILEIIQDLGTDNPLVVEQMTHPSMVGCMNQVFEQKSNATIKASWVFVLGKIFESWLQS